MSPRTLLPIVEHQNDPEMLRLLRAASASHARAQRLASGHVVVSTALAVGAVVGVFVPVSLTPLSLVGLVWAVVYAVGASAWTKNEFRRAALLQETFDTRLFGLPWNHVLVGREPSADEISRLARHYRGSPARLRDYYEIQDLPRPSTSSPVSCRTSAGAHASAVATPASYGRVSSCGARRECWPVC